MAVFSNIPRKRVLDGMIVPLFTERLYRVKAGLLQQNLTFDHLYFLKTKSRKIIPHVTK